MSKKKKKSPQVTAQSPTWFSQLLKRRSLFISAAVIIGVFALAASALAVYTVKYKDKIYPGTFIGSVDFGGKTTSEAEEMLKQATENVSKGITLSLDGQDIKESLTAQTIDLSYNLDETVHGLYSIGRSGNLALDIEDIIQSIFSKNIGSAISTVNGDKVTALVTTVAQKHGSPAQDAKIILDSAKDPVISPANDGLGLSATKLQSDLKLALAQLKTKIELKTEVLKPTVTQEQAEPALAKVKIYLAKAPITFSADGKQTTATTDEVFNWITYELVDATASPSPLPSLSPEAMQKLFIPAHAETSPPLKVLQARVDETKVKDFLATFASTVNQEPQNAELRVVDGTIKVTKDHHDGKRIKVDEAATQTVEKLNNSETTAVTIAVPFESVEATIKATSIESLGIKELIGRGETDFKGSPSNRMHNIKTGASFLNGQIIPPGQEFSTIKTLGKVDGSTGYLPELVIKDNRTTPEFGGGLCQVSTTLFRATLNAGLPITARRNHSYRVSYYEPPVGLDATIFINPNVDFKFRNDTPGYILIQSKVEGTKISFEIYGTKDGRTSSITEPIVSNITEPPEPSYTDTDTLKKGETKQIEKAHAGATAVVTYTVMRDGKEINKQTFTSRYKAWQARFLVGTRE